MMQFAIVIPAHPVDADNLHAGCFVLQAMGPYAKSFRHPRVSIKWLRLNSHSQSDAFWAWTITKLKQVLEASSGGIIKQDKRVRCANRIDQFSVCQDGLAQRLSGLSARRRRSMPKDAVDQSGAGRPGGVVAGLQTNSAAGQAQIAWIPCQKLPC